MELNERKYTWPEIEAALYKEVQYQLQPFGKCIVDLNKLCPKVRARLSAQVRRLNGGVSLIAAERSRQIESEGYSLEHDDQHTHGELAIQAAALAIDGTDACITHPDYEEDESVDPWGLVTKHHGQWERELVIAGALIAAEIDRQQRSAARALPAKEKP
jgi:hypothetical protein